MSQIPTGGPAEPDFIDPLSCYDPPNYKDDVEEALAEVPVGQLKTWPYVTLDAATPVRDAVSRLADMDVACLLITSEEKLVGVLTERDILTKVAEEYTQVSDQPVSNFMTTNLATVSENDSSATAVCVLAVHGYRHVPVVDHDGKIKGVLSPNRILSFLGRFMSASYRASGF